MENKIIEVLKNLFPDQADWLINKAAQEISSLLKGEGEYYQKVYIKSEDDLPKDGLYIAHYKMYKTDSPAGTILSQYDHLNSHKKQNWLERIDWYLQPVSLPDKELIAKSGRKYRSIPDDVDLETWDNMTVAERLHYKNLIITNNKDAIIQKQDEIIEHLSGMSPDICAECRRLETELENLKKQ